MKYILILLTLISFKSSSQNLLKFDKVNTQCEDKWIAHQINKDSTYTFGFIYIDSAAGLTFNYEGKFKIDENGKFNRIKEEPISLKARLESNRIALAEIPESKFKELNIEKIPDWLKFYKRDENSVDRLYRWGFMYNGWNECEKALTYLEKAEKIDPNFKGLQTELAYSYNALEKYEKAEIALLKAIKNNPNDCYSYKELAYTDTKLKRFEKVAETYNKMVSICNEGNFIIETAYNLAYEYFKLKDKTKFVNWKNEVKKNSKSENRYTKNLDQMETDFDK